MKQRKTQYSVLQKHNISFRELTFKIEQTLFAHGEMETTRKEEA